MVSMAFSYKQELNIKKKKKLAHPQEIHSYFILCEAFKSTAVWK